MRREELHLTDIVEATDAIQRFVQGVRRENFLHDELRQSAVLQKLIVIGEAAARLPERFRDRHPEVEWATSSGFATLPFTSTSLWIGPSSGWRQRKMLLTCDKKSPPRSLQRNTLAVEA